VTTPTPRIMKNLPLTSLLLLAACSAADTSTSVTTRDSAGVQIIEHPAAAVAATPAWTLGPASVTIDHGATDEALFTRVSDAVRLSDGRIVVVNSEDDGAEPLLYRADGTFERPLGRQGSGPGEFRSASLLNCRAADTLCIFDFMARRITRMLPDGSVAATLDLSRVGQMALGFPRGILPDGRLVSLPFLFDTVSSGGEIFRSPNAIVVVDPAVGDPDTVATGIPGASTYLGAMSFGDRSMSFPMPAGYGAQTLVTVIGDQVVVADNESSDIVSYALPWAPRRIVRIARARTAVDAPAREAYIESNLRDIQRLMSPAMAAFRDQAIERAKKTKFTDSMPFYGNLRVGTDGALWLMEVRTAADSTRSFLVLGPDGHLAARATIPDAAQLLWVSATEALVMLRDADDVPRVELRGIQKPTE
jgi:hypothetical protein